MQKKQLSTLLKLIAHPERMAILFLLLENEYSLNEMADKLNLPATLVSTHLAKMRSEGIVDYTRYHRVIEYRLTSEEAALILRTLHDLENHKAA